MDKSELKLSAENEEELGDHRTTFISHLFSRHLPSTYYVPVANTGAWDINSSKISSLWLRDLQGEMDE